jgi:hypothetical protein
MKNFAEEICYWYFRLNGFFLLENYVLHRSDTNSSHYADIDLLGIRTKNVKEEVGLSETEDICSHLKTLIPNIGERTSG